MSSASGSCPNQESREYRLASDDAVRASDGISLSSLLYTVLNEQLAKTTMTTVNK